VDFQFLQEPDNSFQLIVGLSFYLYSPVLIGTVKIQYRAQARQDERGWQTEGFVVIEAGADTMLNCCIT